MARIRAILVLFVLLCTVLVVQAPPATGADGEPETTVLAPAQNQVLSSPLTLRGTTMDDTAVDRVLVGIRDRTTGLWLQPDGSFASFFLHEATVDTPGATNSDWSFSASLPPGRYGTNIRSIDADGMVESSRQIVRFKIATDDGPSTTVLVPQQNQVVTSPLTLSGLTSDSTAVDRVQVAIRDRATGLWLRPNGTFAGFIRHEANVTSPGATISGWSWTATLPPGKYAAKVRSIDASGNIDNSLKNIKFLVEAGVDDPITFRAIADVPYTPSELTEMLAELPNLNADESFVVHLGDIKSGASSNCVDSYYETVSDALLTAPVPAYIIPGDNEWNDCNDIDQAWNFWDEYFGNFESNFSDGPTVLRQTARPENFALIQSGVAFIGINRVGNQQPGQADWDQIDDDNAAWIAEVLGGPGASTTSAVVFGHALPDSGLIAPVASYAKPVLYTMGDIHEYAVGVPFPGSAPNLTVVILDAAMPGLSITATHDPLDPWTLDRTP